MVIIHVEAFRHSEENTDRTIVFTICRTIYYTLYGFIQQKQLLTSKLIAIQFKVRVN